MIHVSPSHPYIASLPTSLDHSRDFKFSYLRCLEYRHLEFFPYDLITYQTRGHITGY